MEFGSGSFGERMVMVCQICGDPHHEQPRQVMRQDDQGRWVKKTCPMCICLDCVQTKSDPIRAQLRPKIMGQTLESKYNLEVESFEKGTAGPVKKNISFDAPGPFDTRKAIKEMNELLGMGLQGPQAPKPHRIGSVGCGCGKAASVKCVACDDPLCVKCLKSHKCKTG